MMMSMNNSLSSLSLSLVGHLFQTFLMYTWSIFASLTSHIGIDIFMVPRYILFFFFLFFLYWSFIEVGSNPWLAWFKTWQFFFFFSRISGYLPVDLCKPYGLREVDVFVRHGLSELDICEAYGFLEVVVFVIWHGAQLASSRDLSWGLRLTCSREVMGLTTCSSWGSRLGSRRDSSWASRIGSVQ